MRIRDWSSDVCSSDLVVHHRPLDRKDAPVVIGNNKNERLYRHHTLAKVIATPCRSRDRGVPRGTPRVHSHCPSRAAAYSAARVAVPAIVATSANSTSRSEEHTSELQSLMRISSAVFCLK